MQNQSGFAPIQIILSIIASTIVLGGVVGGVLYFTKSELPEGQQNKIQQQGKCGDGVCDALEKANSDLCPKDCTGTENPVSGTTPPTTTTPKTGDTVSVESSSKDSPFGFIMGVSIDRDIAISYMNDLGAKWIRLGGVSGVIWDFVEKTKGQYNWDASDSMFTAFYQKGINILVTVGVSNNAHQSERGYLPKDIDAYKSFLLAAVERYDGDGNNDAPGSPIVSAWQIGNEVDSIAEWSDTSENYAKLMEASYDAIKSADTNTKVVIAGMGSGGPVAFSKYTQILSYMKNKAYFDIFDFHWHATSGGNYREHKTLAPNKVLNFDSVLGEVKSMLADNNHKTAEIWITEMSASDILPVGNTEKTQAIDLIKRYVYPLAKGVDIIFWGTLYEQSGFGSEFSGKKAGNTNYFDTQALINNPKNDGLSHKKLAYYTYKKMVEVLDGSDWNNIQTIQESDGVYIYKFTKQGKPIWVAWNDNSGSKQVTISGITTSSVKVTEAIPKYESGKDVTNYSTAFNTETKTVSGGKVTITLSDVPVFVE